MIAYVGADTYAARQKATQQLQNLVAENDAEIVMLDGEENSAAELQEATAAVGLFGQKAVFLKRPFASRDLVEYLTQHFDVLQTNAIVLWQPDEPDKRSKLYKALAKANLLESFPKPRLKEVRSWLQQELKEIETQITTDVVDVLLERVGQDKWLLSQEITKLKLFAESSKELITIEVLDKIMGVDANGDIWKLLDHLGNGDKPQALKQYRLLRKHGLETQYLFAMLLRELDLIAAVLQLKRAGGDYKSLKLHPFVLEKTQRKARRFDLQKVKRLSLALVRLDMALKQGGMDEESALALYLLSW